MCSTPGLLASEAGTAGNMKSGCFTAVGSTGGGVRRAQPAITAATITTATTVAPRRSRRKSTDINDILLPVSRNALTAFLGRGRGQAFDEPARHVRFDDDATVGGNVADDAGDAIQAGDLLAGGNPSSVGGGGDASRVERPPGRP